MQLKALKDHDIDSICTCIKHYGNPSDPKIYSIGANQFLNRKEYLAHIESLICRESQTCFVHSFFIEGLKCGAQGLYLAGATSLLCGIEALIRVVLNGAPENIDPLHAFHRGALISYRALKRLRNHYGVNLSCFEWEGESFASKDKVPQDFELLRIRDQILHGNLSSMSEEFEAVKTHYFINKDDVEALYYQLIRIGIKVLLELGNVLKNHQNQKFLSGG
ncbi:MAG: hypothetical protein VX730_00910 [Pseudomonadota bacterium]|nr:hypothetical protein [Pseudomonadota bacterium]